jgi:hypothetical protein
MSVIRIFLDTPVLREAFIGEVNGRDWKQDYRLPTNVHLITAHKCLAEMYGILKTSILENELISYGLVSSKRLRDGLFSSDDFLNIFWHHQTLESLHQALAEAPEADQHRDKLQALIEWRVGYEQVRQDFDAFLKEQAIECIHYGVLFASHGWQAKFDDLAIDTLTPSEDLEIVLSAWFAQADIFLTRDNGLIRFSFSLPLEPGVPVFCTPKELEQKLIEKQQGVITFQERTPEETERGDGR